MKDNGRMIIEMDLEGKFLMIKLIILAFLKMGLDMAKENL
jgi:hypothetical protein